MILKINIVINSAILRIFLRLRLELFYGKAREYIYQGYLN